MAEGLVGAGQEVLAEITDGAQMPTVRRRATTDSNGYFLLRGLPVGMGPVYLVCMPTGTAPNTAFPALGLGPITPLTGGSKEPGLLIPSGKCPSYWRSASDPVTRERQRHHDLCRSSPNPSRYRGLRHLGGAGGCCRHRGHLGPATLQRPSDWFFWCQRQAALESHGHCHRSRIKPGYGRRNRNHQPGLPLIADLRRHEKGQGSITLAFSLRSLETTFQRACSLRHR